MPEGARAWEDCCFISSDYSGIELLTLAQSCIWVTGYSKLGDIILSSTKGPGILHGYFAAKILNTTLEDVEKRRKAGEKQATDARQVCKPVNFSLGGGAGALRVTLTMRLKNSGTTKTPDYEEDAEGNVVRGVEYDGIRPCVLIEGAMRCAPRAEDKVTEWRGNPSPPVCRRCVELVEHLRAEWLGLFDEVPKFHNFIKRLTQTTNTIAFPIADCVRRASGRNEKPYSELANGMFQGLAALGMKRALWRVVRECYLGRKPDGTPSPLYGTRLPFTVHDEFFGEAWRRLAGKAAERMAEVMIYSMQEFVPDVAKGVVVEPALALRWLKGAEEYRVDGELTPWDLSPDGQKALAKIARRAAA